METIKKYLTENNLLDYEIWLTAYRFLKHEIIYYDYITDKNHTILDRKFKTLQIKRAGNYLDIFAKIF